jgi:DNA-binding NarL/FixJ family response regulator
VGVAGGGAVVAAGQLILYGSRSGISRRASEVLGLIAEGRSNAAIAETLVVTPRAVEKYVKNIVQKLRLAPADSVHRRVLAVVQYLEAC